jgi:3-methyladenine DNA glycosylase/8-oxoguanine DNA glycosylase
MLRCGTLWEDMVKMLTTTNCTWRLTQIMVENLVMKLGGPEKNNKSEGALHAFPDANAIAARNEDYLRNKIKMGYRAPYLLEFSRAVTNNTLDLNQFEDAAIPTDKVYKNLRKIKGFGDYAVSNLLKLLGRYDFLGADSWSRQKFAEKHNKGEPVDDTEIESSYKKFGKWSGLFFWMDVSEDWYKKERPW